MNVSQAAGLDAIVYDGGEQKDHLLESTGCGIAFLDYDGDGKLDIYVVRGWALDEEPSAVRTKGRNVLYRNRGDGTFKDVTTAAGVGDDGWGCGVCCADYDNDGWVDIYVTNFGPNRLYRNLGDGKFEEVSARAGVDDTGWGGGASFFDADGDGFLDLYLANYVECTLDDVLRARRTTLWREKVKVMIGPFGLRGGKDRFFHNNGDGTFRDTTDEVGMTDLAEGYGLGVLAGDLDNDGDVDVYVANDSNPNYLYRNDGDGSFTEVGGWCGAGLDAAGNAQAGMGVDSADIDGDLLPEIFVANFAHDHCTLYRNQGRLFFDDVTDAFGVTRPTYEPLSWGCGFFDFDLDGRLDLLVVNGHIYPQVDDVPELNEHYRQEPLLLRNQKSRFAPVTKSTGGGLESSISGRGLALGDYDDDGDVDVLISGMDAAPLLLRNDTSRRGHWLKLRLQSPTGGPAINARAIVHAGGAAQTRELRSGSTYQSQNAMDLHFGVGPATIIDQLEIKWPSGRSTVKKAVPADQTIVLRDQIP